MRRRACIVLAGIAALAAPAAAGCGESGGSPSTSAAAAGAQSPSGAVVSRQQVVRSSPGTPERTVLEWWRDIQRNDPAHARRLYVEPPDLADLAGQFNFVAGWLDGSVAMVGEERDGNRAVAHLRWTPPGGEPRRVSLRLEEDGGRWRLRDARFVDAMVAARRPVEGGGQG